MITPAGLSLIFVSVRSAVGVSAVLAVLELLALLGSKVPGGTVTVAVLEILPVAEPATVPEIVMVTEPPDGSVATFPVTLLPITETLAGQVAPPVALPQLAVTPEMRLLTASAKLLVLAALGPALLINRV